LRTERDQLSHVLVYRKKSQRN